MKFLKDITHLLAHSPAIFLLGLIVGLVVHNLWDIDITSDFFGMIAGLVFLAISSLLYFWALTFQNRAYMPFDPADHKFMRGPYKYSRHPVYFSMICMIFSIALLVNSFVLLLILLGLFILFTYVIIPSEERLLSEKHAEAYARYKKQVPMWFGL